MNKTIFGISNKWVFFTVLVISILFLGIPGFLKEKTNITIHDNLDSNFVWQTMAIRMQKNTHEIIEGDFFSYSPKWVFEGNALVMVFWKLFPPLFAYIINDYVIKIIAFLGIYLLFTSYTKNKQKDAISFLAFSYAAIPFYPNYGISSAGLPLLVWALGNLKESKKVFLSIAIAFFFALYSSFALVGIFVCATLAAYICFCLLRGERNKYLVFSLLILSFGYIITNINLFYGFFGGNETDLSHRSQFLIDPQIDIKSYISETMSLFLNTQYHSGAFSIGPILTIIILVAIFRINKKVFIIKNDLRYGIIISASIILIILFFFTYKTISAKLSKIFPLIITFQWDRFYFFLPTLWFLLFGLALNQLINTKFYKLCWLLICVNIIAIFTGSMNRDVVKNVLTITNIRMPSGNLTYGNFYDEALFAQIKKDIELPSSDYKVASLGIHPAVSQFNGFHTIDGYSSSYSLAYKLRFRNIIKDELKKSEKWQRYFDNWGSRCYLFSSELENNLGTIGKKQNSIVRELSIDTKSMYEMGARYLFSAVEIRNASDIKLSLKKTYESEASYWKIYLYEIQIL